jgi:hypothetical protein
MEFIIRSKVKGDHTVFFDEEDLPLVNRYGWNLFRGRHGFYAQTTVRVKGKWKKVGLHVLIMNPSDGMQVDHRDGNTLNNRRNNLRLATPMQNCHNRGLSSKNTSGYKGVQKLAKNGKYIALICANKKVHHGGKEFDTAEEAAVRWNEMALEYHGEFARLNIIPSQ